MRYLWIASMKTIVLLGVTVCASVGIIALNMPQHRAFADLRNAVTPPKLAEQATMKHGALPTAPSVTHPVTRQRADEPQPPLVTRRDTHLVPSLVVDNTELTREHGRAQAFQRLLSTQAREEAAIDTKYFKGSVFAGCAKACDPLNPCTSLTDPLPKSARLDATRNQMETERERLEQIRETIEDEHSRGNLPIDRYKRLMVRYVCGIKTYQSKMSSSLNLADAHSF